MNEENEYYKPSLEDFYVGFEFEKKYAITELPYKTIFERWDKLIFNKEDSLDTIDFQISLEGIRVKYLDQEDIESLGFGLVKTEEKKFILNPEEEYDKRTIQKFKEYDFIKDKWLIIYNNYTKKVIIKLNNTFGCEYLGLIKNKSELIKILKMIGI